MIYAKETMDREFDALQVDEVPLNDKIDIFGKVIRWQMGKVLKTEGIYRLLPRPEVYAEIRCTILENKDKTARDIRNAVKRNIYRLAKNYGFNIKWNKEDNATTVYRRNLNIANHFEVQEWDAITTKGKRKHPKELFVEKVIDHCIDHGIKATIKKFNLPNTKEVKRYLAHCVPHLKPPKFKYVKPANPQPLTGKAKERALEAAILYTEGKHTTMEILEKLNMSEATFYRHLRKLGVKIKRPTYRTKN